MSKRKLTADLRTFSRSSSLEINLFHNARIHKRCQYKSNRLPHLRSFIKENCSKEQEDKEDAEQDEEEEKEKEKFHAKEMFGNREAPLTECEFNELCALTNQHIG